MVHSFCLVFLISAWFPLETVCSEDKTTEEENIVPLQDFKVKLSPGFINITWNCNITESMKQYHYWVEPLEGHPYFLKLPECSYVHEVHTFANLEIHKGVKVQLVIKNKTSDKKHVIGIKAMPEGKNNSAAENFACVIYNVSIMNCSWTAGKEAPEDTQYSLVLRQYPNKISECQDYRTDSVGRQVGCVLKRPNISFNSNVYAAVLGSSKQTSIQFFDKVYLPIQDVILDAPRNITLTYNSDELEVKWQKPETYDDDMPGFGFWYTIIFNGKVIKNISESVENVYKTTEYDPHVKVTVAMRAKWAPKHSQHSKWSSWSKPITGGNSPPLTSHHILIVLGVVTPIILIVLIVLCYRFRIWMRLFPQIPKPSMKLFEQVEQKEKSVSQELEVEIISMKKEEEFLCSLVTEMPENKNELNNV